MERELTIMNTMFKKRRIHKYTFVRMAHGRMVEKALMDYVVVSKRVNGSVLDVNVLRGESGGMSDHYLIESLLRIDGRWNKRKRGGHREVLRVSRLYDKEKEREYKMSIGNVWSEVKEREGERVEEEWQCFKDEIMKCAKGVCGMRQVGGVRRKGSEWWNGGVVK